MPGFGRAQNASLPTLYERCAQSVKRGASTPAATLRIDAGRGHRGHPVLPEMAGLSPGPLNRASSSGDGCLLSHLFGR